MTNLLGELFLDGKVYLLISIYLFLITIWENSTNNFEKRQFMFCMSFLILTMFTSLRWETGTDWDSYKELFDSIEFDWTFLLNVYSFDIGYVLLNALVRIFTNNYSIFLFVDSSLALILLLFFIKKYSPYPNLSAFVFFNAFFVSQFMGSNRRIIALVLVLYSFVSILSSNKKKITVYSSFAFSFHRSSLVTICALFLPQKRFSFLKIFCLLSLGLLIGIPQIPSLVLGDIGNFFLSLYYNPIFEKLAFYAENSATPENINPVLQLIFSAIKRIIFILFYFQIIRARNGFLDTLTDYFFNIYILGFFLYLCLNGSTIFQMLSTYFTFIEIVLIGRMWAYAKPKLRLAFMFFLFIYGFFQLLSSLNSYPELYIPYKSVFSIP